MEDAEKGFGKVFAYYPTETGIEGYSIHDADLSIPDFKTAQSALGVTTCRDYRCAEADWIFEAKQDAYDFYNRNILPGLREDLESIESFFREEE